ncbi:hypothetical protein MHYP_G00121640 [Metynnis hypsauchen]
MRKVRRVEDVGEEPNTKAAQRGQELIIQGTETTEEPIVEVHWNLEDMLCNHVTMYNGLTRLTPDVGTL